MDDTGKIERLLQLGRFSVTGIVTLMLVTVFCAAFLMRLIDNQVFTQVVGMVVAYWFGASTTRPMPPPPPPSSKTVEKDASGTTREVLVTGTPGGAAPAPVL